MNEDLFYAAISAMLLLEANRDLPWQNVTVTDDEDGTSRTITVESALEELKVAVENFEKYHDWIPDIPGDDN